MFINFGNYYFFKKNIKERHDRCQNCNQISAIRSYDAFRFFHIFFIPLIPLGKKHVYNDCKICGKVNEQAWNQWQITKDEQINQSLSMYKNKAENSDLAIQMHATYDIYGSEEIARQFAETLAKNFPNSPDVLSYLASWYMTKKEYDIALNFAQKTLTIDSVNDKARYILGNIYLIKNDLLNAKEYYCSIRKIDDRNFFTSLLNLAIKLRKNNQNREAYDVLKYTLIACDEQANGHAMFRKEVKLLEKKLGIVSTILRPRAGAKKDIFIAASIISGLLILFLLYNVLCFYNQKLILVNGTIKPVEVVISKDNIITVPQNSFKDVTISEGTYNFTITTGNKNKYTRKITIANSYLNRILDKNAFVVNIEKAGIIIKEELIYINEKMKNKEKIPEGKYELFAGEDFYSFQDIDYPFTDSPETIQMDKHDEKKIHIQLSMLKQDPLSMIRILLDHLDIITPNNILTYMEGQIKNGYRHPRFIKEYMFIAEKFQKPDRAKKFLTLLRKE